MKIRRARFEDSTAVASTQVDSYHTAYVGILPDAYLAHFACEEQEQDWRDLLTAGTNAILLVVGVSEDEIAGYAPGAARPESTSGCTTAS